MCRSEKNWNKTLKLPLCFLLREDVFSSKDFVLALFERCFLALEFLPTDSELESELESELLELSPDDDDDWVDVSRFFFFVLDLIFSWTGVPFDFIFFCDLLLGISRERLGDARFLEVRLELKERVWLGLGCLARDLLKTKQKLIWLSKKI